LAAPLGALVLTILTVAPRSAEAQRAHGMADKGHLFLAADRIMPILAVERTSTSFQQNDATITDSVSRTSTVLMLSSPLDRLTVHTIPRAGVDYAVIDHLTVGGFVALGFGLGGSNSREVVRPNVKNETSQDAGTGTLVGVGPRVGYILPVGDVLALWLRGGLSFYSLSNRAYVDENNVQVRNSTTTTSLSLDLDPQLSIVPTEHFFLGVGPLVNIPITGSRSVESVRGNQTTKVSNDFSQLHIGISASIGGWLSL
jgi:hypothetical protein